MSVLILPSRRIAQPQGLVRLNPANQFGNPVIAVTGGGNFARQVGKGANTYSAVGTVAQQATANGRSYSLGGTSDYINLGTTAPLSSNTAPFTFSWWEQAGSTASFQAIMCVLPVGAAQRFIIFRNNADATYKNISFGQGSGPSVDSSTAPALVVGASHRFVLVARNGTSSTTPSDYNLYVDGMLQTLINASSANFGSVPANLNYLGWDGADSKWNGQLDDMFLWDFAFTTSQAYAYMAAPQQLFTPSKSRIWTGDVAAGGGAVLTSSASATPASSASLTTAITAAASASAVPSTTASLTTGIAMSSSASAAAAATANLLTVIALSSSAQAQASGAGTLTTGAPPWTAAGVAQAIGAANLTTQILLVAAGRAAPSSTGNLTISLAVFPTPPQVSSGIVYGPNGNDYVGTATVGGGSYVRRR